MLQPGEGLEQHKPIFVSSDRPKSLGDSCRFKISEKWIPGARTKVRVRAIPYVTEWGTISSNGLVYWKCSSAQWIATLAATVYGRLHRRATRSNRYKMGRGSRDLLAGISIFYTITLDEWAIERLYGCAKRNHGAARRLLYRLVQLMDENQRFLYGQMCQSILWLQSRGDSNHGAKSIVRKTICAQYRNFDQKSYSAERQIKTYLNEISDPWIRNVIQTNGGGTPDPRISKGVTFVQDTKRLRRRAY